jgi:hypothetical protein
MSGSGAEDVPVGPGEARVQAGMLRSQLLQLRGKIKRLAKHCSRPDSHAPPCRVGQMHIKSPDGRFNSQVAEYALWKWLVKQNSNGVAPSSWMLNQMYVVFLRMQGPLTRRQNIQAMNWSSSPSAMKQWSHRWRKKWDVANKILAAGKSLPLHEQTKKVRVQGPPMTCTRFGLQTESTSSTV